MNQSFSGKYAVRKARAPKRGPGAPTEKQINGLRKQMEKAVTVDVANGLKTFRKGIQPQDMLKAFLSGKYRSVMDYSRGPKLADVFKDAVASLEDVAQKAADITIKRGLPKDIGNRLAFDNRNANIREYVQTRTGALVQNVDDETKSFLSRLVSENFANVRATPALTAEIAEQLKNGIGLNEQQQNALTRFSIGGGPNDRPSQSAVEQKREEMLQQRASAIARTETSYATNQGQLLVWQTARDEELIDSDSRKVWHAIGPLPCLICDPMDEVEVGIDEEFDLVTGETILAPPAHPNCYCVMSISNTAGGTENLKPGHGIDLDGEDDSEGEE